MILDYYKEINLLEAKFKTERLGRVLKCFKRVAVNIPGVSPLSPHVTAERTGSKWI